MPEASQKRVEEWQSRNIIGFLEGKVPTGESSGQGTLSNCGDKIDGPVETE